MEGSDVTLICKARGHPAPEITWSREDNKPILINRPGAKHKRKYI